MSGGGGKIEVILNDTLISQIDDSTLLRKTEAASDYLTKSDASTSYLTKSDAEKDYLSKSDASSTYLSKSTASTDYLSKSDASSTYLSKSTASTDYLSKSDAEKDYLTKSDASSTYLTTSDASKTYLAKSSTDGKLNTPGKVLTTNDIGTSFTGALTASDLVATVRHLNMCTFPLIAMLSPVSGDVNREQDEQGFVYDTMSSDSYTTLFLEQSTIDFSKSRINNILIVPHYVVSSRGKIYEVTLASGNNKYVYLNQLGSEFRMPYIQRVRNCTFSFEASNANIDFGNAVRDNVWLNMSISTVTYNSVTIGPKFGPGVSFAPPGDVNQRYTIILRKAGRESLLDTDQYSIDMETYYRNKNPDGTVYVSIVVDACLADIEANKTLLANLFKHTWNECVANGNIRVV